MSAETADGVAQAALALRAGDFLLARSLLEAALAHDRSPEVLDLFGQVLYAQGEYGECIAYREQAYAAFRARGDDRAAALVAAWLALVHGIAFANDAATSGWLGRARSLIETEGDCRERGWVVLLDAYLAGDPATRLQLITEAEMIGRRFGDDDLVFLARGDAGEHLIEEGRYAEGIALLDESVVAAASGEVRDAIIAQYIYCGMLQVCELTFDVRRAGQWISAIQAMPGRSMAVPPTTFLCRAYYAGILAAAGRWDEAEQALEESARANEPSHAAIRTAALVRLADLRVQQGRIEEAARLLKGLEDDPRAVRAVAYIHLARGSVELAATALRRNVDRYGDGVLQAPVLALLAEVESLAGRTEHARELCEHLQVLARRHGLPLVRARAELAAGICCRRAGDPRAVAHLEAALAEFAAAGLPFEEARARLELAHVLAEGNPEVAAAEASAALERFESLSASRAADEAASLLRSLGASGRSRSRGSGALTGREEEVLQLIAEGLTNDQVAERLVISRRTAEHHVSNILAKLGATTRAEAIAYALRHPR